MNPNEIMSFTDCVQCVLLAVLLIDWCVRLGRSASDAWDKELDAALRETFDSKE